MSQRQDHLSKHKMEATIELDKWLYHEGDKLTSREVAKLEHRARRRRNAIRRKTQRKA